MRACAGYWVGRLRSIRADAIRQSAVRSSRELPLDYVSHATFFNPPLEGAPTFPGRFHMDDLVGIDVNLSQRYSPGRRGRSQWLFWHAF